MGSKLTGVEVVNRSFIISPRSKLPSSEPCNTVLCPFQQFFSYMRHVCIYLHVCVCYLPSCSIEITKLQAHTRVLFVCLDSYITNPSKLHYTDSNLLRNYCADRNIICSKTKARCFNFKHFGLVLILLPVLNEALLHSVPYDS